MIRGKKNRGAWVGEKSRNAEAWIQVDLGKTFNVTAVQTQGRNGIAQWITKFTLHYGSNDNNWTALTDEDGKEKVSYIDTRHIDISQLM